VDEYSNAGFREGPTGRPSYGTLGGTSGKPSSEKRKYPKLQFDVFWRAAKRYAELTNGDPLIHHAVGESIHGLVDFLRTERQRVPAHVLRNAERLECLLFSGYDPHFEGDEPPGL
jgi:hypothetical protein